MGYRAPSGCPPRTLRSRVRRRAFPLVDFVLPSTCFACGLPLGVHQSMGACIDCWIGLTPLPGPTCRRCALPCPPSTDLLGPAGGACARCLRSGSPLEEVRAAVAYEGAARRFLLRVKLSRRRELLPAMGLGLAALVRHWGLARGCAAIVPLPSHPWTRARRGFWPALELAREVARATGVPVRRKLLAAGLRLSRPTKRLRRVERMARGGRGMRVRRPPPGDRILLIDDVMTTGSTLLAAASLLKEAGARQVVGAVWARTVGDRADRPV